MYIGALSDRLSHPESLEMMIARIARYIARSPIKKPLYPVVDKVLQGVGRLNARGYDLEETILAVCPGRSGSTWLAEIVSALQGSVIIWEPLHPENNPRCKAAGFGWQNYFGDDSDYPLQRSYLEDLYTGRDLSTRTLTSLELNPRRLASFNRYVVKHVNANTILHRIMEWFPVRAVLMVRHPCAVIASQLKHRGWALSKEDINLSDELLDEFPHLGSTFERLNTIEELLAFGWAVQTYVPLSRPSPHPWYLTTYERLVAGGEEEVERIFEYLQEPCPETAKVQLEKPSATAGKEASVRQNENRLTGWTERLGSDQIDRILQTVNACGVEYYDRSLTPDEEALPLRPEQPHLFE
jgi:hypothetical protein